MELKELTQKILAIFCIDSPTGLSERIYDVVMGAYSHSINDEYPKRCHDLSIDWFQ